MTSNPRVAARFVLQWATPLSPWIAFFVVLVCGPCVSVGQTYLFDRIQLYDATTNKVVEIAKPSNISATQNIILPSNLPTRGQILSIQSVSGNDVTLGWATAAIGTVPPSDRLTADQDALAPSGLNISVAADKSYSYRGILLVNRKNVATGTPSDNFAIKITGPSNTIDTHINARCLNCPANTTPVPGYNTGNNPVFTLKKVVGTTATTVNFDPAGTGSANYSMCAIAIEGDVTVGSTAGVFNVTVTRGETPVGDNNVVLSAQSYMVLREIK